MKIAVYCTGGTKIGFGHFLRSKTFVKSAPAYAKVLLLPVVDEEDKHIFNDISAITVPCNSEASALTVVSEFKPDIFVFDTVYCSDHFFDVIKKTGSKTASISPVFNHIPRLHYLFTRNRHVEPIDGVKVFKGLQYAIFNENCRFIPDEIYFHNLSREFLIVGIAMGGGDAPNKTLQVLKSLSQLDVPCMFWVLLGEGYRHSYQDLVSSIRKDSHHEIVMAKTNKSMWNILSNCCVAILAGGLTTIEAVYAGLPTLNIFENENHLNATGTQIFEEGVAENIGLFNDDSLHKLRDRLSFLNRNKSQLLQMRERSKGKVDKLASARIYETLREVATTR